MKKAIIIGAGPAGLTAAFELLKRTDIKPIIVEKDNQVGGLSKTIEYHGNRIDIGGHRFFSKSESIIKWWLGFLPLEKNTEEQQIHLTYQQKKASFDIKDFGDGEKVMLLRPRKSRIYYQQHFFDYPLQLNYATFRKLGLAKMMAILFSYCKYKLFPLKEEINLEQFYINRFGKNLYETFFKDYTEKVWGIPCEKIPSSWGAQRVKDLNISKLIKHSFKKIFRADKSITQQGSSTSLIEQFLYPKYGPGQMWETVAEEIVKMGGEIHLNSSLDCIIGNDSNKLIKAKIKNNANSTEHYLDGDYFFSSMPVKELISSIKNIQVPLEVKKISEGLEYRDFIVVGILVNADNVSEVKSNKQRLTDNWIYIQDKKVKAGRLQIFNNWSPFMVADPQNTWLGIEYFCTETEPFWQMPDAEIIQQAVTEMNRIDILNSTNIKDGLVVRVEKAYPSYNGTYAHFETIKNFLNSIENLFPIGRNGMHRYNNSDHSMLTAMAAVDNIIAGELSKENIWNINTGDEYHEEQSSG